MKEETDKTKTCGTCIYNEDGLCDRLGWLVSDDDQRCNEKYWSGEEK